MGIVMIMGYRCSLFRPTYEVVDLRRNLGALIVRIGFWAHYTIFTIIFIKEAPK